jgi:trimeric autotransporter adhesin
MPGIVSAASEAAQTSPFPKNQSMGKGVRVVTTDMAGNLADPTTEELGLASQADLVPLQSQINHLARRDSQLTEGIASAVSLAQPVLLPGQHFAMRAGWGGFDSANAVGFSAAGVLASNLVRPGFGTLVLDGGVGVGTDQNEVVGRGGVNFGW